MNNRRLPILLTILLSLMLLLLLVRCQPEGPQPFPDPESIEAQTLPPGPQLPDVEIRPEQALVVDQIVVTGGGEDIDLVIGDLPELALEQVTSTSYDYLAEYPPPDNRPGDIRQQTSGKRLRSSDPLSGRQQQAADLRLDLYQFTSGTPSLSETLQQIAAKVEERQDALQIGVVAEPNYVVGFEITGSPWAVEGSPWAVEGSPWAVEGSSTNAQVKASDKFWEQWALRPAPGINLFTGSAPLEGRTVDGTGAGVEVAVFDTSPFESEGGYQFAGWGPPEVEPLALTVSHPVALPTSLAADETSIADHGLFVSGLVYAVAPDSEIHLIRILNDEGQGTLQAFIDALNLYVRERLGEQGSLQNTVINLSLGTAEPDDAELPPEARRAIARMLDLWGYTPLSGDRTPVFSLEIPMLIVESYGGTVIAASGNDSAPQPANDPLPSQIPAAYGLVLGVEASNQTAARSCYSNEGDVLAPGGDGDASCEPAHLTCDVESANCEFGVISYALIATRGFAYWVGTSFATPLLSGMTADVIQAQGGPPPGAVRDTVFCSALATGVIDADAALNACP